VAGDELGDMIAVMLVTLAYPEDFKHVFLDEAKACYGGEACRWRPEQT
jgi:hypothetical protein